MTVCEIIYIGHASGAYLYRPTGTFCNRLARNNAYDEHCMHTGAADLDLEGSDSYALHGLRFDDFAGEGE